MKDQRFTTIKALLKEGAITKFTDIFKWIPYTVLAAEYGTNNNRMKRMIADPSLWQLQEIYKLAELIECDPKKLGLMAIEQVHQMKKSYPDVDKLEDGE